MSGRALRHTGHVDKRAWCNPPWTPGAPSRFRELERLLRDVRFRPGWTFHLMTYGHETMLAVELECTDTYTGRPALVGHRIPVPPMGAWRRPAWRRWLLDTCIMVDTHEACEWFQERVGAPLPSISARDVDVCDPVGPSPREEWVRPFDPHHDPMSHAYHIVDWLGDRGDA